MFLPLSLAVPPTRLDRQAGDRHADVNEALVVGIGLDVIGVVEQDAAVAQRIDVVLVAVLVERDQEIGLVAGGEDLAADPMRTWKIDGPPEIVDGIVM